ncbi:unnamed protein product [Prunus armeniaca]|uniref:Uncharacterized protein n=1 Tax=Prunus armeniaca TaxID=36596 RepID=A0A6J5W6Z3_PRUAR|nr:unnamed protein product [Prunus armeniaca]CAB4293988.1 unnamed protein product [Prunus armeniaca]
MDPCRTSTDLKILGLPLVIQEFDSLKHQLSLPFARASFVDTLGLDSLRSDLRPSPLNGLWNSALDEALTNNENFWKPTSLVHAFLVVSILLKKIVTCGANIYLTSKLFLVRGGAAAPPCAFVDLPVVLVKGPCMPEFD